MSQVPSCVESASQRLVPSQVPAIDVELLSSEITT